MYKIVSDKQTNNILCREKKLQRLDMSTIVAHDKVVILDTGSAWTRAGFVSDDLPLVEIPTVVETQLNSRSIKRYPIDCGWVRSWDEMERFLEIVFQNHLKIPVEDYGVLMSEQIMTHKANREKMTQIMFESFNVQTFFISNKSVLSLYASGRTTGIVFDSRDAITHMVPIYEGYCVKSAVVGRNSVAGRDVDFLLQKLVMDKTNLVNTYNGREILRNIKHELCYIASDFDEELKKQCIGKKVELPDGSVLNLNTELFKAPEMLFNPQLGDRQIMGLQWFLHDSILRCDEDLRATLYENILLSGGNTMFPGFAPRLMSEMKTLLGVSKNKVLIHGYWNQCKYGGSLGSDVIELLNDYYTAPKIAIHAPSRETWTKSTWIGGNIVASSMHSDEWITRDDYEDYGPLLIHRKCF